MKEDKHKLDHLHGGQVSLPPEMFLNLGSTGRQEVVCVHAHMHQCVQHPAEGGVATPSILGTKPGEEGQGAVVNNMQSGQVVKLLAKEEEE